MNVFKRQCNWKTLLREIKLEENGELVTNVPCPIKVESLIWWIFKKNDFCIIEIGNRSILSNQRLQTYLESFMIFFLNHTWDGSLQLLLYKAYCDLSLHEVLKIQRYYLYSTFYFDYVGIRFCWHTSIRTIFTKIITHNLHIHEEITLITPGQDIAGKHFNGDCKSGQIKSKIATLYCIIGDQIYWFISM
jgi:hypothetical protein